MKINNILLVSLLSFKFFLAFGHTSINNLFNINRNLNVFVDKGDPEIDRLNIKIQQLNSGVFDTFKFELVIAEIQGSFAAKKITAMVKESLFNDVNSILASRIYSECDKFLLKTSGNCANEIRWLKLLESKIGSNQRTINYKNKLNDQLRQIELYSFYSNSLPKEIRRWINSGEINFDMNTYSKYRSQLSNMPANFKYKNEKKLNIIHNDIRNELDIFLSKWQTAN